MGKVEKIKRKYIVCTVTNDLNFDQRMIRICTTLTAAGFDVTLVGWICGKANPLIHKSYQQKRIKLFFTKGKLRYIEYNIRLFLWLLFRKIDILNAIDLDTIVPNYIVKFLRRKKIVYDAHEYFTELPELMGRPRTKAIWKAIADYYIPRIEHNYTVCKSIADIFESTYDRKFEVIRNVPFRKELEENMLDGQRIILYQGWLNLGRGLPEMINAMQFIEDAVFWLAGDGDLAQQLKDQVLELGLEQKVRFLGKLTPDNLWGVTQKAFIGINFLENLGLNNYYSLANKSFDYIQAGIPAIHMNFPEYQHINKEYDIALLIPDLKVETILTNINILLKDSNIYSKLKGNTYKAAKNLNWECESRKLLSIYNSL